MRFMHAIHPLQRSGHFLADLCHHGWGLLGLIMAWTWHLEALDDEILWDDGEPEQK